MLAPMFAMDQNKTQEERILTPEDAGGGVIVSPDTRRTNRVPPGQSRTRKWPILDTSGAPPIALDSWKFSIGGLVAQPQEWNWQQFQAIDRVTVFADFHCVTHWSRLGNVWEGVSTRKLLELAGEIAKKVMDFILEAALDAFPAGRKIYGILKKAGDAITSSIRNSATISSNGMISRSSPGAQPSSIR